MTLNCKHGKNILVMKCWIHTHTVHAAERARRETDDFHVCHASLSAFQAVDLFSFLPLVWVETSLAAAVMNLCNTTPKLPVHIS